MTPEPGAGKLSKSTRAPARMEEQVADYLHRLDVERRMSPHTLKAYKADLSEFSEFLAPRLP